MTGPSLLRLRGIRDNISSSGLNRHTMAAIVALLLMTASCGKKGPTTPTLAPVSSGAVTVTFNLFSHTQRALGAVHRSVSPGETVTLRIAELQLPGVDPHLLIVRQPAANGRVGARVGVAPCDPEMPVVGELCGAIDVQDPGTFRYQAHVNQTFDVFLMSTANGADYRGCVAQALANAKPAFRRRGGAFATLRLARGGEHLFDGEVAADASSDIAFRYAADVYNRALNPFGVRYGQLDYVGSSPADITGGYVAAPALPWAGATDASDFWIRIRPDGPIDEPTGPFAYETVFHEIGHAFLGQPDQYLGADEDSFPCRFPVEPFGDFSGWTDGWPVLSDVQRDILAYWALLLS